jgi:hypothetical protein
MCKVFTIFVLSFLSMPMGEASLGAAQRCCAHIALSAWTKSLSKTSQKKLVGGGVGVVALGLFIYWWFTPQSEQKLKDALASIEQDPDMQYLRQDMGKKLGKESALRYHLRLMGCGEGRKFSIQELLVRRRKPTTLLAGVALVEYLQKRRLALKKKLPKVLLHGATRNQRADDAFDQQLQQILAVVRADVVYQYELEHGAPCPDSIEYSRGGLQALVDQNRALAKQYFGT